MNREEIPADLMSPFGSGFEQHISAVAEFIQMVPVADASGISIEEIEIK